MIDLRSQKLLIMASQSFDPAAYPIVLYDGQCLICDGFVRWIIRRDKKKIFKFSGLGSDKAEYEIIRRQIPMPKNGTVILLHRDIFQMESDAVISILKMMGLSSFLITFIQIFPKKWRDKIYGWIALHRYRIFKKRNYCPMPSPEEASRFV